MRPFRAKAKKTKQNKSPFHHRGLECKHRKARDQEIHGIISKFSLGVQNEAGQRLIEFCQENTLVIANPLPTTQETALHIDITR